MSTLTLMRLYLRYQSMPRLPLPCIGNAGILYSSPLVDRQRHIFREEAGVTTASPELKGTSKIPMKKGSIGSLFFRRYSTSVDDIKKAEKERQDKNKFKLRTQETVKVMVVSESGSLSAMTLEEANRLAKKKNLSLVHITDPKEKPVRSEKEIYKLVPKLAVIEDEEEMQDPSSPSKDKQKEVKTVLLKSNTGDHDVSSKVNQMKKWIKKGHRVRVMISQAGDKGSSEVIFKKIEAEVAEVDGQIQQKITKGNELRFYVGPPKKEKTSKLPAKSKDKSSKKKDAEVNENDADSDDDDYNEKKKKRADGSS